jgi:hypothetical protein
VRTSKTLPCSGHSIAQSLQSVLISPSPKKPPRWVHSLSIAKKVPCTFTRAISMSDASNRRRARWYVLDVCHFNEACHRLLLIPLIAVNARIPTLLADGAASSILRAIVAREVVRNWEPAPSYARGGRGGSAAGAAGGTMTAAASLSRNAPSSWMVVMSGAGKTTVVFLSTPISTSV